MRLETCSSWRVIIFVVILKNCLHLWVYIVVIGMQDAKFFYLTSALDGGWVVKATPRHLYCRETDLIPTVQVDGPHGLSVHVRKASPPLGMDSRTVNSVASRMLKWIQFNAFHTIWQEAALSGMCGAAPKCVVLPQNVWCCPKMCGAAPKFVWVSWEEPQSILRQRRASQFLNMGIRSDMQKTATFNDCTCTRTYKAKDLLSVWGHSHVDFRIISAKTFMKWRRCRRIN